MNRYVPLDLIDLLFQCDDWAGFQVVTQNIRHFDGDSSDFRCVANIGQGGHQVQCVIEKMRVDLSLQHLQPCLLFVQLAGIHILCTAYQTLCQPVVTLHDAGEFIACIFQRFYGTARAVFTAIDLLHKLADIVGKSSGNQCGQQETGKYQK